MPRGSSYLPRGFIFTIMIKATSNGGLHLTDPENDRKDLRNLLNILKIELCLIEVRECKKLVRTAIAISTAAVLLLLILILR